jgi:hypothetical protein
MENLMVRCVHEVAKYTNTHVGYNSINFLKMNITRISLAPEVAGIAPLAVHARTKQFAR